MGTRTNRLRDAKLTDENYLASQRIWGLKDDPDAGWMGVASKLGRALMAKDELGRFKQTLAAGEKKETDFKRNIAQILSGAPTKSMAFRENDNLFGQPTRQDNLTAPTPTFNIPTANPRQKIEQAYLGSDIDGNPDLGLRMALARLEKDKKAKTAIAARDEERTYAERLLREQRAYEGTVRGEEKATKIEVANIKKAGAKGLLSKAEIKVLEGHMSVYKERANKARELDAYVPTFREHLKKNAPELYGKYVQAFGGQLPAEPQPNISSGNVPAPQNQPGGSLLTGTPPQKPETIAQARKRNQIETSRLNIYEAYAKGEIPKIAEDSTLVRKGLDSIRQLSGILENLETGKFASQKATIQGWAKAGFNINDAALSNAEAFRTISMKFVLSLIAQTKGAISQQENIMFSEASPNIGNSAQGNKLILKMAKALGERQLKINQYRQQLILSSEPLGSVEDKITKFKENLYKKEIFDKKDMEFLAQNARSRKPEPEVPSNLDGLDLQQRIDRLRKKYLLPTAQR